jgi:hypothetical protein
VKEERHTGPFSTPLLRMTGLDKLAHPLQHSVLIFGLVLWDLDHGFRDSDVSEGTGDSG